MKKVVSKSFKQKVFEVVTSIPKGEVRTYKEVAQLAGSPRAFRAVGNILNTNYDPKIPCHRVVRSDGKAGGYNRGESAKISILIKEGLSRCNIFDFVTTEYVEALFLYFRKSK